MEPWFDKSFPPVAPARLPELLERLRSAPRRVGDCVRAVPHTLRTRRRDGAWSIHENVGHLGDLEPLWLGRVVDLVAGEPVLRPADLENHATHEANHNARPLEELLAAFGEQRAQLVALLEDLPSDWAERTAEHPRLGTSMGFADLAAFVAAHDDHHLERIELLAREAG